MSGSDNGLPSEAAISTKLRDIVVVIHKTGKAEDLTLKRVRARAEKELDLDAGFFKQNAQWKQKSQVIINDAVDKYCAHVSTPDPAPKTAVTKPKAKSTEKRSKNASEKSQGVKRKATTPAKKPKKRKKASSEEESEPELSDPESEPPKQPVRRRKPIVPQDSDDEEPRAPKTTNNATNLVADQESDAEPVPRVNKPDRPRAPDTKNDGSESDMSELIDESPVKKSKQKKSSSEMTKKKKEKAPAKSKAPPAKSKGTDSPEDAEIKRLQAWLVKCGIRKIWSRDPELSKCETAKEKITVLKSMLKDAGMDGKYSNEKAAAIKEQREFAKDLAAIQEGELAWGKTADVTTSGRPSRRAAAKPAPRPNVILSDDSDEDMASKDSVSMRKDDDDMVDGSGDGKEDNDSRDASSDLD